MNCVERVLSVDPGIDNLGIGICDLNHTTMRLRVLTAYTLHPDKLTTNYTGMDYQSVRDYKLSLIQHEIIRVYETFGFTKLILESNYMGASAAAFKSLTECVSAIKSVAWEIDPTLPVHLYEPSTIKTTMGVGGTDGDKEHMRSALLNNRNIEYSEFVNPMQLDEHSIDTVCIAYHHLAGNYVSI